MRIFDELRYAVIIEIVWTFYLKSVPAKFRKYLKLISWVISGTSSSKLPCNPRHPSRDISCNHRHHLLQPSWRRIFSTSNNQKTMVDSDIDSDYKASSFDKLYIRRRKWDTAGFVRAHQQKYWNALTVGRGHADDGCSCNHRAVPPSEWLGGPMGRGPMTWGTNERGTIKRIPLGVRKGNERRSYNVTIGMGKNGWTNEKGDQWEGDQWV